MYIKGDVRLWIKGDLSIHGSPKILMAPNATLRLYMGGSLDMSGQCVFNTGSSAGDCTIYGLPTCTSMKLSGGADLYMQVYAPQAAVKMSGNFDFSGSLVAKTIDCTGLAGIHYDEAFGVAVGQWYWITSWEEL